MTTDYSTLSDEELVKLYNQQKEPIADYSSMSDDELKAAYQQQQGGKAITPSNELPIPLAKSHMAGEEPQSRFLNRVENIGGKTNAMMSKLKDIVMGAGEVPLSMATGMVGQGAGIMGSVAAGLTGQPDETAKGFREYTSDLYTYKPQTDSGKAAMEVLNKLLSPLSKPREWATEAGGEQWGNVADVAMLGLAPKIPGAVKWAKSAPFKTVESLEALKARAIEQGINKGLRPSYSNRSKFSTANAFDENAANNVETLVRDKANNVFTKNGEGFEEVRGQTPKTLGEWAEANNNRLAKAAQERTAIDEANGSQGVQVHGSEIAPIFDEVISNPRMTNTVRNAAAEIQDLVGRNDNMTPAQAHELLTSLNQLSKSYYEGKNIPAGEMAKVAADKLREQMANKYVEGGPEYAQLGKEMRDALSVERDIQRRLRVDKRANPYGFFDLANIASAADLAAAITTMNPARLMGAAGIQAAKLWMKHNNKPNYQVKSMFNKVEKYNDLINKKKGNMGLENWSEAMRPDDTSSVTGAPGQYLGYEGSFTGKMPRPTTRAIGNDPNSYRQKQLGYDLQAERNRPADAVFAKDEPLIRGKGMTSRTWSKDPSLVSGDIDNIVGTRGGKTQTAAEILKDGQQMMYQDIPVTVHIKGHKAFVEFPDGSMKEVK